MIWLVGNKGMLGTEMEKRLIAAQLPYLATDKEVDISSRESLVAYLDEQMALYRKSQPEARLNWIINCAAYTAVDKAEDEPELAYRINSQGPAQLARLAAEQQAILMHVSTDYVFDGTKEEAYYEEDKTSPLGIYGKSKREGEEQIFTQLRQFYIIRTAWLYGRYGNNFVHTMLRLFKERPAVRIVADQWGSPTYAGDLAGAMVTIIRQSAAKDHPFGIYHFTNEGKINWYQFAREIYTLARNYSLLSGQVSIEPITTADFPTRATRPKNSYLAKDKIRTTFALPIRDWQTALEEFIKEYNE